MSKVTAKSAVFNHLRFMVSECYNNEKNEVVPFKYYRWNRKLSKEAEKFFYDLTWLLMETNYFNNEAKCFMKNPWLPLKGIVNELSINNNEGHSLNINTVQTKIFRCRERFVRDFGNEIMTDILEANDKNLEQYTEKLNKLLVENGKLDIISLTALNGDCERTDDINKDVSDEDFDYFIDMVTPYTQRVMDIVLKEMDKSVLGYANYLLNTPSISGKDLERKEELINRLGLKTLINEKAEVK